MLDICLTVLKSYLLSIPCVLFMNYGRPKSLKNSHLRWYYYTVNDLVSPPLTGVWTPPACCATASWSGFPSGWQNKPSCPASMPAAPTHRCWRAGACSQSARRSLCVVSDAFTWSNNFMHTHTVMPSKLQFICDRFSIYKLTQIVQYFPPWFLDKLISLDGIVIEIYYIYSFLGYHQSKLLRKYFSWNAKKLPNIPNYSRSEQLLYISFKFSLLLFSQTTSQSLKSQCSQRPSQPSRAPMWHSSARPPAPATRPWPSLGRKTMRSWTTQRSTTRPICVCRQAREARQRWQSIRPPCSYVMWSFPARESTSASSPTTLDLHIPPRPGSLSTVSLRWEKEDCWGFVSI